MVVDYPNLEIPPPLGSKIHILDTLRVPCPGTNTCPLCVATAAIVIGDQDWHTLFKPIMSCIEYEQDKLP